MPTYTYQCAACAHSFDAFQRFAEATLTACPECAGQIRRVIQPTPIVFKGSGWYINDSKPKPKDKDGAATKTKDGDDKTDAAAKAKETDKTDKSEGKGDKEKGEAKPEKAAAKTDKPAPVAAGAGSA